MLESLHVRPHICVRLRSGPLRSWIDPFVDALEQRGYTSGGRRRYVHAADAFSTWLIRHRLAVSAIDHSVVARFASSQKRWHRPSWMAVAVQRAQDIGAEIVIVDTIGHALQPFDDVKICHNRRNRRLNLFLTWRRRYRRYLSSARNQAASGSSRYS